jgi:hypothetical protein
MVRPSNGLNYDTFILGTYFSTVVDGKPAADAITLEAIALINQLPENVSLEDEALVILARRAYDRVANNEQRALVTEYAKLTKAEKRIADLKYLENENTPVEPPVEDDPPVDNTDETPVFVIILIVVGSLVGVALIAGGVIFTVITVRRKKSATETVSEAGAVKVESEAETSETENTDEV